MIALRVVCRRPLSQNGKRAGQFMVPHPIFDVAVPGRGRLRQMHGHDTGGLVLQHVAAVIAENIRAGDLVGRWGGEEFLVACMDCAPQHAVIVAENIRQRIEASPFGSRHRIAVTASLGASTMRAGDSLNSAFRRADAAMYRAKSMGRNRIVVDDEMEEIAESATSE